MTIPVALTIAGSDSSGGAGIQADLKTFAAFGVYGASVITALTAQNTREVRGVHAVPAGFVSAQLEAVFDDLEVAAVKIGMLGNAAAIDVVVGALGSIFIGVLLNGMALINVPAIWQMVIQGVVIIAAVALYSVARSRNA